LIIFAIENRLIPTDLRKDALALQKNIDWKDDGADGNHFILVTNSKLNFIT
jgi:hypothetical protein